MEPEEVKVEAAPEVTESSPMPEAAPEMVETSPAAPVEATDLAAPTE